MGGLGTCAGAAAGIRLIYIFISHQLAGGGAGGRAGAVMRRGKFVEVGTVEEILRRPAHCTRRH
jgi:ABC-type microcin C transport system duplicated ATPase subunit YejF